MGAVLFSDEIQHAIERQVEAGRATSAAAFVEEAVLRLIDDAHAEDGEICRAVVAGIADIEAGRYTILATPEDRLLLHERMMAQLRETMTTR